VTVKVLDASAVVALLFNEVTREAVVPQLQNSDLYAPELLAFEVANACAKKMRASPGENVALAQAFATFFELPVEFEPVNLPEVVGLAIDTKLSVYDASYLWLALALGAELVTLDIKLANAAQRLLRPA
jgi:predicted nucleic acid-binding protein